MALNIDLIRKKLKAAQEADMKRSANYFSFKDGRNVIRILPPWEGSEDFSRVFGKHWGTTEDGSRFCVYCPRDTFGKHCPVCENIAHEWKSPGLTEERKQFLKDISSGPRYLANVIDLNDKGRGIQVAEFPKTVMEEVWKKMVDEDLGVGDVSDPESGYDLIVDRTGKGIGTKYTVEPKKKSSKLAYPKWKEEIKNLDAFVKEESDDTLKGFLNGKKVETVAIPETASAPPTKVEGTVSEEKPVSIPAPAADPVPVPTDELPACFGKFDENSEKCGDCIECDDCEEKSDDIPAFGTEDPATDAEAINADDLMAEMQAAIER